MSLSAREITRLQRAGWILIFLVCFLASANATLRSADFPFITRGRGPVWIAAPMTQTTNLIAVAPESPPVFTFVKRFSAAEPEPIRIAGRALKSALVRLNGRIVAPATAVASWKQGFALEAAAGLLAGRNELRVEVQNANGPPLLALRVEGDSGLAFETDLDWQIVPPQGNPAQVVIARDTAIYPEARQFERPDVLLVDSALPLALVFALATAVAWLLDRRLGAERRAALPRFLLIALSVLWVVIFVRKFIHLPLLLGFDVPAHLLYIDSILADSKLPLAHEGFSSYHPPLFHLLTSLLVGGFGVDRTGNAGQIVYRLIPFLAGLANLWLAHGVARRLWPDHTLRVGLAVGVAGLLPMNLYMSAYVSNEPLHAAWVSLALLLATRLILAERDEPRLWLGLALCLGAALLTKYTSLLLAPLIGVFACARLWLVDGRSPTRALGRLCALVGAVALLSGWFYVRNWIIYGDALVWNLDIPGVATWYMQPGFHTTDYYTRFGEVLRYPYFAGFSSFWDGVYSTLWGDGLAAGMIRIATRHGLWNYDAMALCYPLALPATALFGLGLARMLHGASAGDDVPRRIVTSMLCVVLCLLAFSLFYITLRLPFYAQARAPYVLSAVLPLALVGASGLAILPERLASPRHALARALYFGWLGTLAAVIAATFAW